jgi:acetyl-CoA carboxylase biotin carboxyl carrier protein
LPFGLRSLSCLTLEGRAADHTSQSDTDREGPYYGIDKRMGEKTRDRKASAERDLNLEELQKLIDMLAERDVTEFEMERNGLRLRFRRDRAGSNLPVPGEASGGVGHQGAFGSTPAMSAGGPDAAPAVAQSAPEAEPAADVADDVFVIKSPIVGTFYGSPAPNAPPFVKVHDIVQVGQVLCIVEAMKLMNEIESEVAGEIVRIYIESGQPVEYGQPLFAIQPSHGK